MIRIDSQYVRMVLKRVDLWNECKNKVLPRFELGLLDSESNVLTITPQDHTNHYTHCTLILNGTIHTHSHLQPRTQPSSTTPIHIQHITSQYIINTIPIQQQYNTDTDWVQIFSYCCCILSMTTLERLAASIGQLETSLHSLIPPHDAHIQHTLNILEELDTDMGDNISKTITQLDNSSQTLTLVITINRLTSQDSVELPRLEFSLKYQNLRLTGNDKLLQINEEITQKFVLPVLQGDQELTIQLDQAGEYIKDLYDEVVINLSDILLGQEDKPVYHLASRLRNSSNIQIEYSISVQGFGLNSWKKQCHADQLLREARTLKRESVSSPMSLRSQARRTSFNNIFQHRAVCLTEAKLSTFESNIAELDSLLNILSTQL